MNTSLTSQKFPRIAAVVFVALAAAVAAIRSRSGDEATVLAPLERGEVDALVSELARCRTITPDDTAVLETCRRIWAENRQHFFLSTKSPPPPAAPAPDASAEPIKNQARSSLDGNERRGAR
jgi:conjugative transfer region protein TrbK